VAALLADCPATELEPVFAVDCDVISREPVPAELWLLGLALPVISPVPGLAELEGALDVSAPETGAPLCWELLLALVSPLLLLPLELPVLAFTVSWSFTCLMPAIDFAASSARFLSAFEATVPVIRAVRLVTET